MAPQASAVAGTKLQFFVDMEIYFTKFLVITKTFISTDKEYSILHLVKSAKCLDAL